MNALICNVLCFSKTEINRFEPISGGVFLTQRHTNRKNLQLDRRKKEIEASN